jgi:hypothetical protein
LTNTVAVVLSPAITGIKYLLELPKIQQFIYMLKSTVVLARTRLRSLAFRDLGLTGVPLLTIISESFKSGLFPD